MKKVFLIVQQKDLLPAMEELQNVGLMHVEPFQPPAGPKISELKEAMERVGYIVSVLGQFPDAAPQEPLKDWRQEMHAVCGCIKTIEQIKDDLEHLRFLIHKWEPWGNFNPEDIVALKEKGIFTHLVEVPKAMIAQLPEDMCFYAIFEKDSLVRGVVFSKNPDALQLTTLKLPEESLDELLCLQKEEEQKLRALENTLHLYSKYRQAFEAAYQELRFDLMFQEAYQGRRDEEALSVLRGFAPEDALPQLLQVAQENKWGTLVEEPAEEDQVPTLLRNPRWVNLIKPVMQMINVLPGYGEMDVSKLFLIFFSIFFGILIGDAGYGLIFGLGTWFAQLKFKRPGQDQTPFYLMYVLSACTVVWGMLTGTFFGQAWLKDWITPLCPWLTDNTNVQLLCFFIGAVHLSIAHVWRAIMKMPSITTLSEAGWLSILWGMFLLAKRLVLGFPFPSYASFLFIFGAVFIIFFSKPNKNPLKAVGPGIGEFLLNVVNSFTDIVSYIRLFAVGLATVAVADAANAMAMQFGFDSFVSGLITSLILVIGHVLNIVLGAMAILVHGLRLNVLEFSGHLNMEWAGVKYDPLRRK